MNSIKLCLYLLFMATTLQSQQVIRGPYLQQGGTNSLIIKWRTDAPSSSKVWFGTQSGALNSFQENNESVRDHEVLLEGLSPETKYFYAVGSANGILAGDQNYYFITAPEVETSKPVKVWVLGDCGTANNDQRNVRDAYYDYMEEAETDLILLLGDNAYPDGTDYQYQNAIFQNMYEEILLRSPMYSCIGNHDYHSVDYNNVTGPYFDIFSHPTNGELGGVPSGTESYYSFDYANIHFISLDSHASGRDPGDPMLVWLEEDVQTTTQDWIIVIFHHPPYTKGSHDSDDESHHIEMRENVLPILEAHGVDLVLGGHSHNYERSYLLNGHYDYSYTYQSWMAKDNGDGRSNGNGAYQKTMQGGNAGEGAVYIVTGSAGKANSAALNHPAMYYSSGELGSVSLEINGNQLDLKFINDEGNISDYFTLIKDGLATGFAPNVILNNPDNGQNYDLNENISLLAEATDSDGQITKVEFFIDGEYLQTVYESPYEIDWIAEELGSFTIQAKAFDDAGNSKYSQVVTIQIENNIEAEIIMTSCPESIDVSCATDEGTIVTWNEPEFETDCPIVFNVGNCEAHTIQDFVHLGNFEGSNYFVSSISKNWEEAVITCQELGGHLAKISSPEENDFITSNLNVNTAWIGLSDDAEEGNFRWHDGVQMSFTNWGEWQPSNSNGQEHFVQIEKETGEWFDKVSYAQAFILELPCAAADAESENYLNILQTKGLQNGALFSPGVSLITYQAQNACGDQMECSFEVTVDVCDENPESDNCLLDEIAGFDKIGVFGSSAYFLSDNKLNWLEARENCELLGGQLAKIDSEVKNELLLETVRELNIISLIGCSDYLEEGNLIWENGSEFTFSDLEESTNNSSNDFGTLNPWTGKWDLVNEWVEKRYILEMNCPDWQVQGFRQNNDQTFSQKTNNQKNNLQSLLVVSPNPGKGLYNLSYQSDLLQDLNIKVYDVFGRVVFFKSLPAGLDFRASIDLRNLVNGCYILSLTNSNGVRFSKRLIKME